MLRYLKQLTGIIVLILTFFFLLFVINQTVQLVSYAGNVSPVLGRVVLYALLLIYAGIIIIPLLWIGRMPRALFPPEQTDGAAYHDYLCKLSRRLSQNPHLKGLTVDAGDISSLERALKVLDEKADEKIKAGAANVFIMTAISQYGALDALIVLLAQFRMIWQVTTLYHQRPTLKELTYLYSNVLATAFLASKIENLEILEEQLEPVIASVMGSSLSALTPAFTAAANIVTNAVIQGSANAFLTLRVGVITKMYCASLTRPEKGAIRRSAAFQAASLLGKVLSASAYTVSKIVFKAATKAGTRPLRHGQEFIVSASQNAWDASKKAGKKGAELAAGLSDMLKQKKANLLRQKEEEGEK